MHNLPALHHLAPLSMVLRSREAAKLQKLPKILDILMIKICFLNVLNICVGGVGDINVTCPDKVKEVFLSNFPYFFAFVLAWEALGEEWGCGWLCVLWLWEVVEAVLCGGR
jgi:hypothetical protein